MRAIYLMNTEKLEYDLSLLSQRETVHSERISAGKAKINRLQVDHVVVTSSLIFIGHPGTASC